MGSEFLDVKGDHPPHHRSHAEHGVQKRLECHLLVHVSSHLIVTSVITHYVHQNSEDSRQKTVELLVERLQYLHDSDLGIPHSVVGGPLVIR